MAVPRTSTPNRARNIFIAGLVLGFIVALLLGVMRPKTAGVAKTDLDQINDRLGAIEQRLTTPTPEPSASANPGELTISAINKDTKSAIEKKVTVTGKVTNPTEGVGFMLVDTDGSFVWVHTAAKIPASKATVQGKVVILADQLAQWKNEKGWPADDATLTAKLRNEKVFIEAENVS